MRIAFLLSTVLFASPLAAEEFCAVRVQISDETGTPVSAPVELIDPAGKVVASVIAVNGTAKFCDFGFGEHTIAVGGNVCGSVVIRRVRLTYGFPKWFSAVLNHCGGDGGVYPPSCRVYLRVTGDDGKKLGTSELGFGSGPPQVHADSYGRLVVGLLNGKSGDFTISAPGYFGKTVSVSCESYETIEREVKLSR